MEPREVRALRGDVVVRRYGGGTKSERDAVMLVTPDGTLLLRRRHGPSFGKTGLEHLIGKSVECDGTIVDNLLLVDHARALS